MKEKCKIKGWMKIFQAHLNQKTTLIVILKTDWRYEKHMALEGLLYSRRSKSKFKILFILSIFFILIC